ncbi:MAG: hypothetical protein ACTSYM_05775 [Candidatus Baldrarchaeia archaeon]
MSLEDKVCRLVKERPDYGEILKNAIKIEESPPSDFIRDYGWEWHDVKAHPGKLTKLVSEGLVKVTYKSRRYTHYKLTDREAISRALKKCLNKI